jgi:hypothetical protein
MNIPSTGFGAAHGLAVVLASCLLLPSPGRAQVAQASPAPWGALVTGKVTLASSAAPVAGARVTLFTPSLSFFREVRTSAGGRYALADVPAGSYRLGVAALGLDYQEIGAALPLGTSVFDFALAPESHPGAWQAIGNTLPELFDATDIAALRPDGFVLFCHDTIDPVLFHPGTGQKLLPAGSGLDQGCMNTTLLDDGSVLFAGGQNGSNFKNAIPWVKRFRPDDTWQQLPSMLLAAGRWYPGLARLADGRLLVMGGGTSPNAERTDTCEVFDPATSSWSWTGRMGSKVEFPPSALLYTGKVLRTWGSMPQLYDPASGTWQDTGQLVFAQRGFPGHSDHSLVLLSDGRALAVGISTAGQATAAMTELYDPASGTWSPLTSPSLKRMQCEVVYLPDGRVLAQGGETAATGGPEPNVLGIVRRSDLFDPATLAWRRVADTPQFREYHAVTLLLPDGRVLTTGGTRIKFQYGPTSADIDAWSPPYLFRGVRPEISGLSAGVVSRGQPLGLSVFPATKLTSAVLMGVQSTTHWLDAGIPRRLVLAVDQTGAQARIVLPADPDRLPLGWYMLFGMVDDIPSPASFVRVVP